jgi:hypothetical protein
MESFPQINFIAWNIGDIHVLRHGKMVGWSSRLPNRLVIVGYDPIPYFNRDETILPIELIITPILRSDCVPHV